MGKIIKLVSFGFLVIVSWLLVFTSKVSARDVVTDWYIQDFRSETTVNKDSSLDVTENITADCGDLPNKHGIFRVLPTQTQLTSSDIIKSPISLISITDFNNNPIKYSTSTDRSNHTVTWKIGDPDRTVTGVNYYRIKYHVKNAVRHTDNQFDEFYWNLSGNFWDIDIDNFAATVIFPDEISQQNSSVNVYTGAVGGKAAFPATAGFTNNSSHLVADVKQTMTPGQGITVSVTFPKNIIAPYVQTFLEKYGDYFYYLIPLLALILSLILWNKFGRDPKINPTIAPEFEIPEKLAPIEMGLVYSDGILKNQYLSASIINLAVHKFIKIEQLPKQGVFGGSDYQLSKLNSGKYQLSAAEKELCDDLFKTGDKVLMSSLKNEFYIYLSGITSTGKDFLVDKNWLIKSSRAWQVGFLSLGLIILATGFIVGFVFIPHLGMAAIITGLILVVFSFFMTRRSVEGAELFRRIKGFKLYRTYAFAQFL